LTPAQLEARAADADAVADRAAARLDQEEELALGVDDDGARPAGAGIIDLLAAEFFAGRRGEVGGLRQRGDGRWSDRRLGGHRRRAGPDPDGAADVVISGQQELDEAAAERAGGRRGEAGGGGESDGRQAEKHGEEKAGRGTHDELQTRRRGPRAKRPRPNLH
jgi:hypothetical protein